MARSGICSLSAIRNRFAKYFEEVLLRTLEWERTSLQD